MVDVLARVGIALLAKLVTEKFLSKVLVHTLRAWSNQSVNDWDDKVVDAIAESLGVDSSSVRQLAVEGKKAV